MRLVHRPIRTFLLLAAMTVAVCLIDSQLVCADEYQAQTPVGKFMQGINPQNWKMPTLQNILPGQIERDQIKKQKDGLVQEVANSAKRSWQKTKDTLNPMKMLQNKMFGGNTGTQPAAQKQGGGFFSSLLGGGEADAKTASGVNDFLRQTKPLQ